MYFLGGTFCLIAFSCKFPTVRTVGLREVIMCAFPCVQIIVWKTARSSILNTFFFAAAGHTVICNVAANPQLLERLEIIFSRSRVTIDVNMFFFVLQPTAEWLRCISLSRNHDSQIPRLWDLQTARLSILLRGCECANTIYATEVDIRAARYSSWLEELSMQSR